MNSHANKLATLGFALSAVGLGCLSSSALADDAMNEARGQFASAFNERNWDAVAGMFADDAVFHRANGDTIYTGPEQIVGRFRDTIAGEWNVMFARLDNVGSTSGSGEDTRTVDVGHFAVTAGGDSDACYAGFYAMTWNKDMKIQILGWQDVLSDMSACK
jgi:hypothetical protein